MPDFDLVNIRKSAVKSVDNFFDALAGKPFVRLEGEEIPEHNKGLSDPNIAAWEGKIDCEGQWCEVKLSLKSTFPDTIPRLYLVDPPTLIPHLTHSRENHICSVFQEEVVVNAKEPVKVVLDTLCAAAKVIADGLSERNYDDFDLEFHRYWAQDAANGLLSIIDAGGKPRDVVLFEFEPPLVRASYLLAETRKQGERWLLNLGVKIKKNPKKALYLPLSNPLRPPFPSTNIEVYECLEATDRECLNNLLSYLTTVHTNERKQFVLFSFGVNRNHAFGGWMQLRIVSLKGFRKNKIPGKVQLTHPLLRKTPILRTKVERIDMSRLQARVGNDEGPNLSQKHVAVVGCGSIGSKIALALAMSGVEKLTLIDKKTLSVENIVRHVCPLSSAKLNKVEAVSKEIHARVPGVEVVKKTADLYHMLTDDLQVFSDLDLLISATGDVNLGLRFNEFHISDGTDFAAIHTWIEAFGIASHSNLVIPGRGGCLNCTFGDDGNYLHRVVTSRASHTLRREAGCGSIFSPYTGLDADLAANTATRLAISFLTGEVQRSVRWTYLGDLKSVKARELSMSQEYQSSGSYRLVKFALPPSTNCEVCIG